MKKLLFVFTLVGAFTVGACTSPEGEACDDFKSARDACEAMNGAQEDDGISYDLCDNVDADCKEFYECAATMPCTEIGGVFRLDYGKTCTMPEDKECTDADLRD